MSLLRLTEELGYLTATPSIAPAIEFFRAISSSIPSFPSTVIGALLGVITTMFGTHLL